MMDVFFEPLALFKLIWVVVFILYFNVSWTRFWCVLTGDFSLFTAKCYAGIHVAKRSRAWGSGTEWTVHQSIAGPFIEQKKKQPFTLTFIALVSIECLFDQTP